MEEILTKALNFQVKPTSVKWVLSVLLTQYLSGLFWLCQLPDPNSHWHSSSSLRKGMEAARRVL